MKKVLSSLLIFILALNFTQKQNKFVSTSFKLKKLSNDRAILQIFLTPTPGIHINSQPAPEISFESKDLKIVDVKFEVDEKNYLNTKKPISFYLALNSKNLNVITGKLTYFYCSEKEGWCSKFTEKFEIKLSEH